MKSSSLHAFLHQHQGSLILTVVIVALGLGLVFTRPDQPALAEQVSTQSLTPVASISVTSQPAFTEAPIATSLPTDLPTQLPSLTPTWTPTQTPTQITTDLPTATATSRPAYLIWSQEGQGGYLREEPNDRIITLLENGTYAEYLGQVTDEAGVRWKYMLVYFWSSSRAGWVAEPLLYPLPDGDLVQVVSEEGAYLRSDPQGSILTWLGNGSPLILLDGETETGGYAWQAVETLDGQQGWVLDRLLTPLEMER